MLTTTYGHEREEKGAERTGYSSAPPFRPRSIKSIIKQITADSKSFFWWFICVSSPQILNDVVQCPVLTVASKRHVQWEAIVYHQLVKSISLPPYHVRVLEKPLIYNAPVGAFCLDIRDSRMALQVHIHVTTWGDHSIYCAGFSATLITTVTFILALTSAFVPLQFIPQLLGAI